MEFTIRQGLDIKIRGVPQKRVSPAKLAHSAAVLGLDYPGIRPKYTVKQGDMVKLGQPLFCDRQRPEIVVTAPQAGEVVHVDPVRRQGFDRLEIRISGDATIGFSHATDSRALMQATGLWTRFLTRPFGAIPDADAKAEAVLVTALDTTPLALDTALVLAEEKAAWRQGLSALAGLDCGPVYVCQGKDAVPLEGLEATVQFVSFKGKHPAGLAGTHLDRLGLSGRPVWQIGFQDVIALGQVVLTGQLPKTRYVALGGPMANSPRVLRVGVGAKLADVLQDEIADGPVQVISGSVLSGWPSEFLGARHNQIALLPAARKAVGKGWFGRRRKAVPQPILIREGFDGLLAQDIPVVPLLRALAVGDWDMAMALGAGDLLEEDLALLSYACPSGNDYGVLLRRALDDYAGASQ